MDDLILEYVMYTKMENSQQQVRKYGAIPLHISVRNKKIHFSHIFGGLKICCPAFPLPNERINTHPMPKYTSTSTSTRRLWQGLGSWGSQKEGEKIKWPIYPNASPSNIKNIYMAINQLIQSTKRLWYYYDKDWDLEAVMNREDIYNWWQIGGNCCQ